MRDLVSFSLLLISVVALLSPCDTNTQPRPQTFPKEFDFRYTSYEDLLSNPETFRVFTNDDVVGVVQLTLDIPRNQLLVGARGVIFRLDLNNLTNLETTAWNSEKKVIEICRSKGQPLSDCYNFVKVLHVYKDQVFACGTNAFRPKCTWRVADDLKNVTKNLGDGVGLSPFDPNYNATGVITSHGDYVSATVVDITARVPVIYRAFSEQSRPNLRTLQDSKWLNEPDFVSAYEIGDFIYFFFHEVAVEYINCGKRRYSRVARVCKNDEGGKLVLENSWTTYFKSRLNCSIPGDYPFYFDEIQGTFLLQHQNETFVYAVFATPEHALPGSAICIYSLPSFKASFSGPYKYQEDAMSAWVRHSNKKGEENCPDDVMTNKRSQGDSDLNLAAQEQEMLITAQKYQMMDNPVQPITNMPYVTGLNERWTHVVADHVEGKDGTMYKVVFVATKDGRLKKMVHLPNQTESCLVEEIKIVPNGEFSPVKKMTISKQHSAVYVSTHDKIIKIPLHRCERFKDSDLCMNSMDPYCGWDETLAQCTARPHNGQSSMLFWQQAMNACPTVEYPVDGGWSEWSPWQQCQQAGSDPSVGGCVCRVRFCNNPAPLYGGNDCTGSSIEVINCTVHGEWTEWTQWTSCSASCGPNGTRTRLRHCSPPKYGGRPCTGKSRDEGFCIGNPSCPEPPIDGNWSPWSPWTDCTSQCGGGIQSRRRACVSPAPSKNGVPCIGNRQEWRMCNMHTCSELHRYTAWTPWVKLNETEAGYMEQRYRFMCRANVNDVKLIKTSHVKTHTRFCYNDRECIRPGELSNSIDTTSPLDHALRRFCKHRRKLFRKFCRCRTLGVFLVCTKCNYKERGR